MIQRGGGARFLDEAAGALVIAHQVRRQDLQRDRSAEHRVLSFVDLAHAAGAETADDLVVAKDRPRLDRVLHSAPS
jgi:hypothetical protein